MVYLDHFIARGPQSKRISKARKKQAQIDRIMDTLSDWRLTPFENEGSVRAGVRSALCVTGEPWQSADIEAAGLVSAGLHRLGAVRPNWDEGQPEYTEPDGMCMWCKGEVVPSDTGRITKFCSAECAKASRLHRAEEWKLRTSSIARAAALTIRRETFQKVPCQHCSTLFVPHNIDARGRKFCSFTCAGANRRAMPERECLNCKKMFWSVSRNQMFCGNKCKGHYARTLHPKECGQCKTLFRPRDRKSNYCSVACRDATARPAIYPCSCAWCGIAFMGKNATSKFCSSSHKSMDYQQRTGRKNLKRPVGNVIPFVPVHMLTAEVFDGWFARAA